jgi:hypothetical protein
MSDSIRIPASRSLPEEWLRRYGTYLVGEVGLQPARERRRRRRLMLVLGPAVLALLAATAFTTYALTREPTHLESIGCFETASLDANTTIVNTDGRAPAVICRELWQQGVVGQAPAPEQLAACVLESGAIGVFPGTRGSTCARLGLAPVPASYARERKRFAALRSAIIAELGEPASGSTRGSSKCVGEQAARVVVRRELDAHGYNQWGIEVAGEGFTAERPCSEVAFEGKQRTVILIPVHR